MKLHDVRQRRFNIPHRSPGDLPKILQTITFSPFKSGIPLKPLPQEQTRRRTRKFTETNPDARKRREARQRISRFTRAIAHAGIFVKILEDGRERPSRETTWSPRVATAPQHTSAWMLGGCGSVDEAGEEASQTMALPTWNDLQDLPPNLKSTFTNLAMETLRRYFYPRLMLYFYRRERQRIFELQKGSCPQMTMEIMQKQTLFKSWPNDLLKQAMDSLSVMVFEADEFILHEDEQAGSGIYFIMSGTVQVLKKISRSSKSIGSDNTTILATLGPVVCVGEFSFLTEEPRMASIRTVTRAHCLVLKKHDFAHFMKNLPHGVFDNVVEAAFATKNRNMHLSHPMTESKLREYCCIFSRCPSKMLEQIIESLRPHCVPKGMVLYHMDDPADAIYFLERGKVGVYKQVNHKIFLYQEDAHVSTYRAPSVIGGTDVLHGGSCSDKVQTTTSCDLWMLPKRTFDIIVQQHPGVHQLMMMEARLERQNQLQKQRNLFRDLIYNIPILKETCSHYHLKQLTHKFEARVYKPLTVICSTANCADRLIVLYKGKVKVGDSLTGTALWAPGEAIGFSCVVPHRWAHIAVAQTVVECLELPRDKYQKFLEEAGVLKTVCRKVKQLMFPLAFPITEVMKAQSHVAGLKTPPFYPQSTSFAVNQHEEGFSELHLDYLEDKRIQQGLSTSPTSRPELLPPPEPLIPVRNKAPKGKWKRVSSYLWVTQAGRKPKPLSLAPKDAELMDSLKFAGKPQ